jgi:hypothetical protein
MSKAKPKITPRTPGKRTTVDDSAAAALLARAEARERGASLQALTTAPVQADEGRAVKRKRGAWTKAEPYQRKDGTATRGTTAYLPVELAERLRRYAFEHDTKQNAIIVAALADYLERAGA